MEIRKLNKEMDTQAALTRELAKANEAYRNTGVALMSDLDLAVIAAYDDGKLTQAVTRGDGFEGSDITHNARYFKGLPQEIRYKDHLVVKGEAVMTFAEFENQS